jgi:hypothetical protein
MARVRVRSLVSGRDCASALRDVTDFARWAAAAESVRSVEVEAGENGTSRSTWEVSFRGGIMRWSELDRLGASGTTHTFALIEGDPRTFAGTWTAEPFRGGCRLTLDAEFDLGMPSVGHVIDPLAIEAFEDTVASVLRSVFGPQVPIELGAP